MKLVLYVLNKTNLLDKFLKELNANGIKGATIISSTGMGRKLFGNEDSPMFGGLRTLFEGTRPESNVIMMVVKDDEQVKTIYNIIDQIAGDLSQPNSGIAFTLPIDSVMGFKG
jgi:nitrogen regulatory protein P-II 1